MNSLIVIGAGGHGIVVAETAAESGRWNAIAFLDDNYPELQHVGEWPVLGKLDSAQDFISKYPQLVVAIGNNKLRIQLLQRYQALDFHMPIVVHPTAFVSRLATLGHGTVVFAQAAVNPLAKLGVGCIINTSATVDHDCQLDDGVHVCPGAHLSGEVSIGRCSSIGIGASVREGVRVGHNVTVGAGAAVIHDQSNEVVTFGVPARSQ